MKKLFTFMKYVMATAMFMLSANVMATDINWNASEQGYGNAQEESSITFDDVVTATYTVFDLSDLTGNGTSSSPYTVADAMTLFAANTIPTDKVYVMGKISRIKSLDTSNYARAQYYISDDGSTSSAELYIYNGYYLNGEAFTSNDQIKVGDDVVVYGKLALFGSTKEMDANNYIYQHNGEGGDIDMPVYETLAAAKSAAKDTAIESILKLNNVVVTYVDGTNYYITDGTDGFLIYGNISGLSDIAVGDVLKGQIKGDLYRYHGLPEIVPATSGTEVTKAGTATVVSKSVAMSDVLENGFAYSNMLVRLSDVVFGASELTTQGNNKHGQATITSNGKEAILFDQFDVLKGITFDTSTTYEIDCIVIVRDGAVQFYPIDRNQFIPIVHISGDEYGGEYWATYYSSQSAKVADDNTTVYVGQLSADKSEIQLTEVTDKTINAREAVILKSTATEITLTATEKVSTYDFIGNSLMGEDEMSPVHTDHGTIYTLSIENGNLAFRQFVGRMLGANKAYLVINDASGAPIRISFGETTSIQNTQMPIDNSSNGYYTIDGRYHNGTPTTRGLYIINGKKVLR